MILLSFPTAADPTEPLYEVQLTSNKGCGVFSGIEGQYKFYPQDNLYSDGHGHGFLCEAVAFVVPSYVLVPSILTGLFEIVKLAEFIE